MTEAMNADENIDESAAEQEEFRKQYTIDRLDSIDDERSMEEAIKADDPFLLLDICDDGVVDVVVRIADGRVFLFKTDTYWQIDMNNFNIIENSESSINETWENLPPNMDIGFTINSDALDWANMSGRTIFLKDRQWYQYENTEYERGGDIDLWFKTREGRNYWGAVMTHINDSIVYLLLKPQRPWDITQPTEGLTFIFDDPFKPDIAQTNIFSSDFQFDYNKIRYLVPLPDGKYLLFFDIKYVGHFCVLKSITSQCNARLVSSLFDCPAIIAQVRNKNWVGIVWWWFGLEVKLFLAIVCGALIASALILFHLIYVLFPRVYLLKQHKNVR
ncbi:matrix metalloproteinase-16-like protein [Leptotrombidium deliense]|uniref:Matrix metalloproteinase-16-like protein n=1 Tax=Leptotrombidium deliense TaxID=299467 RepID=A0A443SS72_9ACAR|nr:matrix metalloproteinase-16-like protein [Leptotrombidium deliense]